MSDKEYGPVLSRANPPIDPSDIQKMYDTKVLSDDSPQGLQNKVFFEIALHFISRSREKLRKLTIDSFEFHQDPNRGKYVTLASNSDNEKPLANEGTKGQRLYATGRPNCPVASLEKYLSRVNPKSPCFFQACIPNAKVGDRFWYNGKPIGSNTIGGMMKRISHDAKLSRVYNNLSIHATAMRGRGAIKFWLPTHMDPQM